ncbi:MAG: tetratricopeptide repeat protein [Isosphaeraceae bacterium]
MTKPQADEHAQTVETPTDGEPVEAAATAPEPEPWTPERVTEWNRYYDLYVAGGVLFLVFLTAAHKIFGSALWPLLEAGRVTISQGWPLTRDPFSFTELGRPWVNISWLFGLLNVLIYDLGHGLTKDPARAEQIAAGLLVGLNATLRTLTVLILLNIRKTGPGLWWVAICATLALGGMVVPSPIRAGVPIAVELGGLAGAAEVDPGTWSLLFLALELAVLHAATSLGRRRALFALPPLFLIWANVDEGFLFGLAVLAAATLGTLAKRPLQEQGDEALTFGRALIVLGICMAVCLVNPSWHRIYPAVVQPLLDMLPGRSGDLTGDQFSFFGAESRAYYDRVFGPGASRVFIAYYLIAVGVVIGSFALNRKRFHLGRFLTVVVAALAWAILRRLSGEFAVVGAVALALNGQEWYQGRYGTTGRLGTGWTLWSIGGRSITLIAIFALIVKGLTGYGGSGADFPVGFGVNTAYLAFEAGDYLRDAPIQGNVVNLTRSHGDAIIWRAWPTNHGRRTYIDNRRHLYPESLRLELSTLRKALGEDDPAIWRPILDRHQASVVTLSIGLDRQALRIYDALKRSPDWVEFYDDGLVFMFGRVDESAPVAKDRTYVQANRLDADAMVYQRGQRLTTTAQPPNPVTWVDRVFRRRALALPGPHALAADRWLGIRWDKADSTPDPAHCYMAIREARIALSKNPDDPAAFKMLNRAYDFLLRAEATILDSTTATDLLMFRFRQRVTALSYAIQTTPPPTTPENRLDLADLHRELAGLFRSVDFLDLERDHLESARALSPPEAFSPEESNRLDQLNTGISQTRQQLEQDAAQQANLLQQADFALSRGMPGYAIERLEAAEELGVSLDNVKSRLVDLYCQTGQPDKSFELVSNIEDPALSTGPGTPAHRQGRVSFLLGDYDNAASLWRDRALKQIRAEVTVGAVQSAQNLLQGNVKPSVAGFVHLPTMLLDEATWEYELGLCLIESGQPDEAASHLTRALTLEPKFPIRPLLLYYLDKLGKPFTEPGETSAKESDQSPVEP